MGKENLVRGRTELSVVLRGIHAEDVGNDAVDVDGADKGGKEELLHQAGLKRAEGWQTQQ